MFILVIILFTAVTKVSVQGSSTGEQYFNITDRGMKKSLISSKLPKQQGQNSTAQNTKEFSCTQKIVVYGQFAQKAGSLPYAQKRLCTRGGGRGGGGGES